MPGAPDLSILIVSYNTRHLLSSCLESLAAACERHSYEVIVADNASSDNTVDMLRRDWPQVHAIEMGGNTGFARANNRAMAEARGRYFLLLNGDTNALGSSLDRLIDFLDATPEAGVAAPRLLNSDLTDQGTARAFPTPAAAVFGRKSVITRLFPHNRWAKRYMLGRAHQGDEPFPVDWVSGACLMVSRKVVDRVGGLDEGFFMHWEDADWCYRIKDAGWAVHCVPVAEVVHHEGKSEQMYGGVDRRGRIGRPARLCWEFHRSAYRYFVKHHASHPLNPFRWIAAVALMARAAVIIAANEAANRRSRRAALAASPQLQTSR